MFEQILSTNLINFIIVILTLRWIFKKARLGELLDKMANDIQIDVEKSAKSAADALSEYKATKKATKDTPALQEEILTGAKFNAQILKKRIENKAQIQKEEITSSVENVYKKQVDKTKKTLVSEIYRACVDIAQAEVIKRLDEKTHKKLIDVSISEVEKIEGNF